MIRVFKIGISFLAAMLVFTNSKAQATKQGCREFHKSRFCWIPGADDFKQFGRSKSTVVEMHQTYKYEVVLPPNRDYKIGTCVEPRFLPLQFRIVNKETEEAIYDNSTDDYVETVGFTVKGKPLTVIIEITPLSTKYKPKDMRDTRACAGIQILYQRLGKDGF
ncbi:MAG TPA: hypothetical protein PK252_11080 [Bacteroidales bacterium]|nr:hypothetical protein [Bacteroidales bacterium]